MSEPALISTTTVVSLLSTVALLCGAWALSQVHLARTASTKTRLIYVWHVFDGLTHVVLEGSFLWYSLTSSAPAAAGAAPTPTLWGRSDTSYGTRYSSAPLAALWNEYARADTRWAVADVGVVCIEAVTVLLGGPLALAVAAMVARADPRRWFWIAVLATAEIYGGWMTFAPEWFGGNANLVTANWMYK